MVAAAALLVAACTSAPAPAPTTGTGSQPTAAAAAPTGSNALGTVTMRIEGDWAHLDPLGRLPGGGLQTGLLLDSLYDSLVIIGPDPNDPSKPALLPYLATRWDQTPDQIVFTMRKDATCPDGTPVNPSLVKRTMDYRLTQAPISPANAFGPGPYTTEADDAAGTFTIKFGTPFTDAIYGFLTQKIVCTPGLDNPTMLEQGASGSGPYQLVEAVHGDHVTMKRRDDWTWGPNGITAKDIPQQIIYKVVTNETTAANLLLTGGLDIGKVAGADLPRLLADPTLTNKSSTSFYNYTIIFSQDPTHPTADPMVRQALVSGADLDQWNQAANQGRGTVSPSFIMPIADCFDANTAQYRVQNPGPDKARQVLMADGYTPGPDGKLQKDGQPLKIVLVSTTTTGLGNGGEYLAEQWNQAGITVDYRVSGDFNTFLQAGTKGDFDAFTTVYPFDQPNPNNALSVFLGPPIPTANNWTKSSNPTAEAAFAAAEKTVGAERCQNWATVQEELLKNWSILPTASPNVYWFSRGIDFFPGASRANVLFFRKAQS
jgi:peptide/nickel transport system substrate-binding protein